MDSRKKTATSTSGHTTAMSAEWSATHDPSSTPGLPNSSRVAATVDDNGFPSARNPSPPHHVYRHLNQNT